MQLSLTVKAIDRREKEKAMARKSDWEVDHFLCSLASSRFEEIGLLSLSKINASTCILLWLFSSVDDGTTISSSRHINMQNNNHRSDGINPNLKQIACRMRAFQTENTKALFTFVCYRRQIVPFELSSGQRRLKFYNLHSVRSACRNGRKVMFNWFV